jgi:hypothetical protein
LLLSRSPARRPTRRSALRRAELAVALRRPSSGSCPRDETGVVAAEDDVAASVEIEGRRGLDGRVPSERRLTLCVTCHPNVIVVEVDEDGSARVWSEPE